MTEEPEPVKARLPIALVVATGHEAQIVRRALRAAKVIDRINNKFEVVQVGVGCRDMDSRHIVDAYTAIVSTGFAGALEPTIKSGSMVFPKVVKKTGNTVYDVDLTLQKMIATNKHTAIAEGALFHTDEILATTEEKHRAHEDNQCIACDMESASLAAVAAEGGRPFACLRIVLDPANIRIPDLIMNLAQSPGEPGAADFLMSQLKHPSQLPATIVFLWHTFKASRALSRSVTQLSQGCYE